MSLELVKEIDYKPNSLSHGEYKHVRVLPTQNPPVLLDASGGQVIEFEIGSNMAVNLSRSVLRFGLSPTNAPTDNTYSNKMYASLLNMRSVELYTRSGLQLCNIQEADFYTDIVWSYDRLEDAMSQDWPNGLAATIANQERCEGGAILSGGNYNIPDYTNPLVPEANPGTLTLVNTTKNLIARRGVYVGTTNAALSPTIIFEIPLSKIKHSIFSRGVDMIFPESIFIRLTTLGIPQVTWESTTLTNANARNDVAQTVTLHSVELLLATQMNMAIKSDLLMAMTKGSLEIDVEFAYLVKQSATTSSQNPNMRISGSSVGSKLRKIYTSAYPQAGTLVSRYNNSITATTIASFNSFLNSSQIEQILVTPQIAYNLQRPYLDRTVTSDRISYLNKFVYLQDFCGKSSTDNDNFYNDGLQIDTADIKYEIQANTGNTNLNWYMFYVTMRKLKISSTMIELL